MKHLAWFVLLSSLCAAQDRSPSVDCPLKATVAGTNVPFRNGEHIVVWFENRTDKSVSRAQFQLTMLDPAGRRHPAMKSYVVDSTVRPGEAGLMMASSIDEAQHLGRQWRLIRGLEVEVANVTFGDGSEWRSSDSTLCKQTFYNAAYEHDMRVWNAALRSDWNRRHPEEPMPGPALAVWLLPHGEGWR